VFPSPDRTFGLVILESLACGTPVAAFPVTERRDDAPSAVSARSTPICGGPALDALRADREACRAHAELYSGVTAAGVVFCRI